MRNMNSLELHSLAAQFAKDFWNMEVSFPVRFVDLDRKYGTYVFKRNKRTGKYTPVEIRISKNYGLDKPENRRQLESVLKHELCHWYCQMSGRSFKDGTRDFEAELLKRGAMSTRLDLFKEESWEKTVQLQQEIASGERTRLGRKGFTYDETDMSPDLERKGAEKVLRVHFQGTFLGEIVKWKAGKYQWTPRCEYHEFNQRYAYLTRKGASETLMKKAKEAGIIE